MSGPFFARLWYLKIVHCFFPLEMQLASRQKKKRSEILKEKEKERKKMKK